MYFLRIFNYWLELLLLFLLDDCDERLVICHGALPVLVWGIHHVLRSCQCWRYYTERQQASAAWHRWTDELFRWNNQWNQLIHSIVLISNTSLGCLLTSVSPNPKSNETEAASKMKQPSKFIPGPFSYNSSIIIDNNRWRWCCGLTTIYMYVPPSIFQSDWDSPDVYLTFTWCSPDVHLTFIWLPDHHLTFPWPSPDPYLTLTRRF